MNLTHFVQFAQASFLPIFADAAGIVFGIVMIAALVIVFIRAFGAFNR